MRRKRRKPRDSFKYFSNILKLVEELTIVVDTSNALRLLLEEHQRISLYTAKLIARFPLQDMSIQRGCNYIEITPYADDKGVIQRCGISYYEDEAKTNLIAKASLPREGLDGAINARHFPELEVTPERCRYSRI